MPQPFELHPAVPLYACLTLAACACAGGLWSVCQAMDCLHEDQRDLPFFSSDPGRITPAGRRWRRRIYLHAAALVAALLLAYVARFG